ncbi:hypothetical protein Sliba_02600 [Streptomyces nigrescens]|uniref:Uncharacterized protein n=1 Tax=Streptomyces nigrescens TaxID=1920 RepID=A0A640T7U7_STRNI|nr:hypothetical protein Sliba_02600 [Streptomyces libani subsp. libani]GGV84885.1 hypothetical protein GCM10010500_00150 [Streptomyces libani subsp. libani]
MHTDGGAQPHGQRTDAEHSPRPAGGGGQRGADGEQRQPAHPGPARQGEERDGRDDQNRHSGGEVPADARAAGRSITPGRGRTTGNPPQSGERTGKLSLRPVVGVVGSGWAHVLVRGSLPCSWHLRT